jgi:hypothetical protein
VLDSRKGHRQNLDRHGRTSAKPVDQLGRIDEYDKALGQRRHDAFASVRSAAALDERQVGIHLVGAVERDVEGRPSASIEPGVIERSKVDPVPAREPLCRERGRDSDDLEALVCDTPSDCLDGLCGRGAGAQTNAHAVLDDSGSRIADGAPRGGQGVLLRCGHVWAR